METISLIIGIVIMLLSAGVINVIRNYINKVKEYKQWEKVKEDAKKDGKITKDEQAIIDKEWKEAKEAKRKFFKSLLTLTSAMFQMKLNKKAKPSDLINKINEAI